jgi:hypothetical protein
MRAIQAWACALSWRITSLGVYLKVTFLYKVSKLDYLKPRDTYLQTDLLEQAKWLNHRLASLQLDLSVNLLTPYRKVLEYDIE